MKPNINFKHFEQATFSAIHFYNGEYRLFIFDVCDGEVFNCRVEWQNIDDDWVEMPEVRRKSARLSDRHLYLTCHSLYRSILSKEYSFIGEIFIVSLDGEHSFEYSFENYIPRDLSKLTEKEIHFIKKRKRYEESTKTSKVPARY